MSIKVGITMPQFTDDAGAFREVALHAEEVGLDSIWVFDHLWPLSGGKERPILECWSALAWLAAATERITIGTMVTRSTLRHPVVLAKMIATLGEIAPGRSVVTIGSGDKLSRDENEAFGLPYFSGDDRTDQLRSTVEIVMRYLENERVTHDDDFASIRSLMSSPSPDPRPEIWVGGRTGEVLEIASDLTDGWNGWGGEPDDFRKDAAQIEAGTERDVTVSWAGLVLPAPSDEEAHDQLKKPKGDRIVGGPETVASRLKGFRSAGATHLILTHVKGWTRESLDLLSDEVIPRLRAG